MTWPSKIGEKIAKLSGKSVYTETQNNEKKSHKFVDFWKNCFKSSYKSVISICFLQSRKICPRGDHGRRNNFDGFASLFMAMKLPFSPLLRPMSKHRAGTQDFTQVLPSVGNLVQSSPGISILRDSHIVLFKQS